MNTLKRRLLKIIIGLFILVFPFLFFKIKFYVFADRIELDGKKAEIANIIFVPGTKYAIGYSHTKFKSIKIGMTEIDVKRIIGEPISYWNPNENSIVLYYSKSMRDSHYRIRQVRLDCGIVSKITHYFYID